MAPDPCECPALACHHSQHRGRQTRLPARPQPQARKLAKIGGHGPWPQRVPSLSMSPHPAPRQTRLPTKPHRTTERSRKLRPGQPQAKKLANIGGHGPRSLRVPSLSMSPHPAPRQTRLPPEPHRATEKSKAPASVDRPKLRKTDLRLPSPARARAATRTHVGPWTHLATIS